MCRPTYPVPVGAELTLVVIGSMMRSDSCETLRLDGDGVELEGLILTLSQDIVDGIEGDGVDFGHDVRVAQALEASIELDLHRALHHDRRSSSISITRGSINISSRRRATDAVGCDGRCSEGEDGSGELHGGKMLDGGRKFGKQQVVLL